MQQRYAQRPAWILVLCGVIAGACEPARGDDLTELYGPREAVSRRASSADEPGMNPSADALTIEEVTHYREMSPTTGAPAKWPCAANTQTAPPLQPRCQAWVISFYPGTKSKRILAQRGPAASRAMGHSPFPPTCG